MTDTTVIIESKILSEEAPINVEVIHQFINELVQEENNFIGSLLERLQQKSSKHKFLVNTCNISSSEAINSNLNVISNFGAIWDSGRDGYVTVKVMKENKAEVHAERKTEQKDDASFDQEMGPLDNSNAPDNTLTDEESRDSSKEFPNQPSDGLDSTLVTVYWIYVG